MRAVATDKLNLKALPDGARDCHKFEDITLPLVSVPKLCDNNMKVVFTKTTVTVTNANGDIVLEGHRDPSNNLYMAALEDTPRQNRTKSKTIDDPIVHTAANVYEIKTVPALIAYLHAAAGFPAKETWLRAIEANFYSTWPAITPARVRRHLIEPEPTTFGHLKMIRKNIRSTKPAPIPEPEPDPEPSSPRSTIHNVGVNVIDTDDIQSNPELKNLIATDLPGRYPITSARGHKYIFVMYDYDSNYINAVPIASRKAADLVRAFTECYGMLTKNGLSARLLHLDNEISHDLIKAIETNRLDYQLASPGDHRLNEAERAIQTFKAHFIAVRSGADPDFPKNCWDLLLEQAVLTLNLLRPSRINPKISAYTQIHGVFDYNRTPLAPAGCKVVVHDRIDDRGTWSEHGTRGFYIRPALKHYRNYDCYMPATRAARTSNTIKFFPTTCPFPTISSTDRIAMILTDLLAVLRDPPKSVPFLQQGTDLNEAILRLQTLLFLDQNNNNNTAIDRNQFDNISAPRVKQGVARPRVQPRIETSVAPIISPHDRTTRSKTARRHAIGTIVRKRFDDGKFYEGEVTKYDPPNKFYAVEYRDGDKEEYTHDEITTHHKKTQQYSRTLKVRPLALHTSSVDRHRMSIPTKANPNPNPKKYNRPQPAARPTAACTNHMACAAGSIWDADLNKMASYKDLINHPDKAIRDRWNQSGVNEFARLFQGFGDVEGVNVLAWIHRSQVPKDKKVTYPRYTVAERPEKDERFRCRITAGGDRLSYDGETSTDSASMETIKTHWNSVLSTQGAKYCTGDISNMYLESWLKESEYVRFQLELIPPEIIAHYNLDQYAVDGYVYAKINRAWYGLKQSGRIAHDDLVEHLAKHDYVKTKHTEGLFRHKTREISFTLVVDDFGIKYIDKADVDHLNRIIREKYKYKVDWEAKQYIGIHLDWDYEKRELIISMNGYVKQALREFEHVPPEFHQYGPSKIERPDYGAKVQYVKHDHSRPLGKKQIKYLQRVVGKFYYYARAIDNTMLHALNDIATATSKGTEATLAAVEHFLDYAASNPDARIRYTACEMILQSISDAAYLVCPQARSRMGGYHFLGNKDRKHFNGPLLVLAKIIKNVMGSAAEAEVGGLYINAQAALPIRQALIEMGHPQPPTPLTTDNVTARGILTGTIKQKRSKSIDMRFYWLKDRVAQNQFVVNWEPGNSNLADYPSKHHPASHHRQVQPIYLYVPNESPKTMQGCVKILTSDSQTVRKLRLNH